MKIEDIFNEILKMGNNAASAATCDTCKAGNLKNNVTKMGVSMFATPEIINICKQKNINFLIVHEPVYYNHMDNELPNKLAILKKKMIDESGITIVRFHDHAHAAEPDLIYAGEIKYMNIPGEQILTNTYAVNRFILNEEMTAKELAEKLEKNLGIRHIRIAGCADKKGKKIGCCFGTPGHVTEELEENDFVLTGEISEWAIGEFARDYAQMGYNKAIIVMGHIGSERAGMMYLADILNKMYPEIETQYLECGEVYSYTD